MHSSLLSGITFAHAFIAAMLWLLFFAATGKGLKFLSRIQGSFFFSFENIITGVIFWVPLCAIWFTKGRTMLLPVPLLLLALLLIRKRHHSSLPSFAEASAGKATSNLQSPPTAPESIRDKLPTADYRTPQCQPPTSKTLGALCFSALLLYFVFYSQAFWTFEPDYIKYPSGDLAYYCRLARHITRFGVENRLVDLPASMQGLWQAYHWGDIWIIPLIASLSGLSEEATLLLVIYPLLSAAFVMGLFTLYQASWKRGRVILILLCLFAPLVASFTFFIPPPWKYEFHFFPAPLAQYPKLLLFGSLMLWALQFVKQRNTRALIILAFITGLLFIGSLPSALMVAGCFTLLQIKNRPEFRRTAISFGLSAAFSGMWIWYLYASQQGNIPYLPDLQHSQATHGFHWRILLTGIVESGMMLPYFFVLIAFLYHTRKSPLWLLRQLSVVEITLFVWLFAGLLSWAILYNASTDSFQFLENVRMIFLPVFVIWCAGLYFQSKKGVWAGGALLMLVACSIGLNWYFCKEAFLTDRIVRSDYQQLQGLLQKVNRRLPLRCVFIKSPIATNRIATRNSTIFYPLEFLGFRNSTIFYPIDNRYTAASLNPITLDEVDTASINFRESLAMRWYTPLMQFVHQNNLPLNNPDADICSFMDSTRPRLLIAANDAYIPTCLHMKLGPDSVQLISKKYRVFLLH